MTFLLNAADPVRAAEWQRSFTERAPQVPFRLWPHVGDTHDIRFLATWLPPKDLARDYPKLEVFFSTGAGVDQLNLQTIPEHIQVVRMVEPGIVNGMVEYVTMMVLALHRDLTAYQAHQRQAYWRQIRVRAASTCSVGVMGLGMLGEAVSRKLIGFGFDVSAWNRSRRLIEGGECFAGQTELSGFLKPLDILICLLPLTDETRGILNTRLFNELPCGAKLINVGRGPHLIMDDLRAALDSGQLAGAVLDVTDPEPLPDDHWLWRDERVLVTPHVASMTQPETAVEAVLDNLRRHAAGQKMVGLVDRARGY